MVDFSFIVSLYVSDLLNIIIRGCRTGCRTVWEVRYFSACTGLPPPMRRCKPIFTFCFVSCKLLMTDLRNNAEIMMMNRTTVLVLVAGYDSYRSSLLRPADDTGGNSGSVRWSPAVRPQDPALPPPAGGLMDVSSAVFPPYSSRLRVLYSSRTRLVLYKGVAVSLLRHIRAQSLPGLSQHTAAHTHCAALRHQHAPLAEYWNHISKFNSCIALSAV